MEFNQLKLLWLISFSILFFEATALKCYNCNSFDSPECLNIKSVIDPKDSTELLRNLSNLEFQPQECGPDEQGREPFCRKISITVLQNNHQRVIRQCGYEPSLKDCYMADNDDHLETVCQCRTDGCNGSAAMYPKYAVMYVAAFFKLWVL